MGRPRKSESKMQRAAVEFVIEPNGLYSAEAIAAKLKQSHHRRLCDNLAAALAAIGRKPVNEFCSGKRLFLGATLLELFQRLSVAEVDGLSIGGVDDAA